MPELDDIISAGQTAASVTPNKEPPRPAPSAGPDPLDRLDLIAAQAPSQAKKTAAPVADSGMLANIGAGTSEGVAHALGGPMDLYTTALGAGVRGINALLGTKIPQPTNYGGTETWENAEGLLGADPRQIATANEPERVARSAARMATEMALPGGAAKAVPEATGTAEAIREAIASGATPSGVMAGGVGGASGELARYAAPEPYKGLAEMAGNVIGGGLTAAGGQLARTAGRFVSHGPIAARLMPGEPLANPETGEPLTDMQGTLIGEREAALAGQRIAAASRLSAADAALQPAQQGAFQSSIPPSAAGAVPATAQPVPPAQPLPVAPAAVGVNPTPPPAASALENLRQTAAAPPTPQTATDRLQSAMADLARQARPGEPAAAPPAVGVNPTPPTPPPVAPPARPAAPQETQERLAQARQNTTRHPFTVERDGEMVPGELVVHGSGHPTGERAFISTEQGDLDVTDRLKAGLSPGQAVADAFIVPETNVAFGAAPPAPPPVATPVESFVTAEPPAPPVAPAAAEPRPVMPEPTVLHDGPTATVTHEVAPPIEGFTPTLGQETGNLGTLSLERELRNRSRELFIQHDAINNAALLRAMGQLAPEDAADAAGRYVRTLLDSLRSGEGADQAAFENVSRARAEALGGDPAINTASDLGAVARERLDQLRQPIRAAAGRSLDLVDPDGTLALSTTSIAQSARQLLGAPSDAAATPFAINARAGEHAAAAELPVLSAAAQMDGVVTFQDLRALLGQVSAAQRALRADSALGIESRPYARMRVLRQALEESMVAGVEDTAAARARPVPPVSTEDLSRWGQSLANDRDQWYGARTAGVAEAGGVRSNPGRNARGRPLPVPGASGAEGPAYRGPGAASGVSPISPEAQPLVPNFDAEAAQRLAVANRAYADYKQRFRQGPVGDVLSSGNSPQGYRIGDSQVVSRLFRPGAQGGEAIDSLLRAAGSQADALRVLGDYPAYSFRAAAQRNGVIDPKAAERWIASHKETLDRLPQLRAQFSDATRASAAVSDNAAMWRAARQDIENSALGRFVDTDPQIAIQRLMQGKNPEAEAADLMRRVAGTPAEDGVRRNAVDWLISRMRGTAEAGTTGERELAKAPLQRLLENQPGQAAALRTILGPDRFTVLGRVSDALDTAARAYQAVAIKGSPGTAADLHALSLTHAQPSMLAWAWMADKAAELGSHLLELGGPAGAIVRTGAAGGAALMRMVRQNGLQRIDDLATEGVLNPQLGRILLGQAAKSERDPRIGLLGRQIQALSMPAATNYGVDQSAGERVRRQPNPALRQAEGLAP